MKKALVATTILMLLAVVMSGCTKNAIPDMSEEQKDMVVEYAVSEVLKYDKNQEQKLVELTELTNREPDSVEVVKETPAPSPAVEEPEREAPVNNPQIIDNTGENQGIISTSTIEQVLNLKDINISFSNYDICDFYPKEAEEIYFEMSATDGNKLLVLVFNVENTASTDQDINISESGARFKITVNDETKNALTTMLLDDLAYFKGTIAAGESKKLVLISEISEQQASNITSLSVLVKNVDNSATIQVQ